jgi:hypothetical protein
MKSSASYGPLYPDLLRSTAEGTVRIPCTSRAEANNLRRKVYSYFKALRSEDSDLVPYCDNLELVVRDAELLWIPRSEAWDTQLLAAAVKDSDTSPTTSAPAINSALERLRKLREERESNK